MRRGAGQGQRLWGGVGWGDSSGVTVVRVSRKKRGNMVRKGEKVCLHRLKGGGSFPSARGTQVKQKTKRRNKSKLVAGVWVPNSDDDAKWIKQDGWVRKKKLLSHLNQCGGLVGFFCSREALVTCAAPRRKGEKEQ